MQPFAESRGRLKFIPQAMTHCVSSTAAPRETRSHLERIAARASALYSRPSVAMQIIRLAEAPQVDPQALKECVVQDPALVCKILRVANSSLFGLHRPVADLNQAIRLLGIKPFKFLVLGFCLPDALLAEAAGREMQWYWTNTLTRAVVARRIAEQLWRWVPPHHAGSSEEAFIAGLLTDVGILVLLRELGQPYARFLAGVINEKCDLAALEQQTLGFDHAQLTAAVLRRWQFPQQLVDAIAIPKRRVKLARMKSPEGDLPQILHLAELLVQLVGQRRLGALGELMEAGRIYRGMTKKMLANLVQGLQQQVDQLAEVLSLELTEDRDYVQILLEAHHHMGALSEEVVCPVQLRSPEDEPYVQLHSYTVQLNNAMQELLQRQSDHVDSSTLATSDKSSNDLDSTGSSEHVVSAENDEISTKPLLVQKLASVARSCRERRQELSLLVVEPSRCELQAAHHAAEVSQLARQALNKACANIEPRHVALLPFSDRGAVAIVANCDRQMAVSIARQAISAFEQIAPADGSGRPARATLSVGVSTASVVPINFDPARMIDRAVRCLSAARMCGFSAVKSIEV